MSDFAINITGHVPDILHYQDGMLLCNNGNGCIIYNADTDEEIGRFTQAVNIPWTPPEGVTNIRLALINPSA